MQTEEIYYPRELMARAIFAWLFAVLVYFFCTGSLLSQLQQPVLFYPSSDNTYWLLHLLKVPQFLMQHTMIALLFDVMLTCSCIICIIVPNQKIFTWFTIIATWLLYVCFCSAAGKHYAQIGYLLSPLPFVVFNKIKFSLLWQLLRYWVCFLYACGGVYKLVYGGFFYEGNMSQILKLMNADWLIFQPGGLQKQHILWLINNPSVAQWVYQLATFAELSLLIGFFTKKADRWLLAILLPFHLGNLWLLHISFFEQSLIFAPFLPWKKWAQHKHSTKSNDRPLTF